MMDLNAVASVCAGHFECAVGCIAGYDSLECKKFASRFGLAEGAGGAARAPGVRETTTSLPRPG